MGLRCSCGVETTPSSSGASAFRFFNPFVIQGGISTFTIDVCSDRLPLSSVILDFEGTDPTFSFTFSSTEISQVTCEEDNGDCVVTVVGTGQVSGETTTRSFTAVFRDRPIPFADVVDSFVIQGFAQLLFPIAVQPDFTVFGCPTTL